jgi:hypothetical protein
MALFREEIHSLRPDVDSLGEKLGALGAKAVSLRAEHVLRKRSLYDEQIDR